MNFNTSNCVISGTPNRSSLFDFIMGFEEFRITVVTERDEITTSLNITLDDNLFPLNQSIIYNTPTLSLRNGTPSPILSPIFGFESTGVPSSWSISPQLPNNLNIDTTTGIISGTPLSETADINYNITVFKDDGSSETTVVTIGIRNAI